MTNKKTKTVVKKPYDPASLILGNSYLTGTEREMIVGETDNPTKMDELNRTILARALSQPEVRGASVMQKFDPSLDLNALASELREQSAEIQKGNMSRAEGMLISQAHTLDALFSSLSRRAHGNMEAGYGEAAERYMKLALRAQNQCRATLEGLSAIKNPPVVFAKQMNVSHGPQQVNNGVASNAPPMAKDVTHAFESKTEQNKLGGSSHELLQDTRAFETISRTMPGASALEAIDRTEDKQR